jgi:hypothetical protein
MGRYRSFLAAISVIALLSLILITCPALAADAGAAEASVVGKYLSQNLEDGDPAPVFMEFWKDHLATSSLHCNTGAEDGDSCAAGTWAVDRDKLTVRLTVDSRKPLAQIMVFARAEGGKNSAGGLPAPLVKQEPTPAEESQIVGKYAGNLRADGGSPGHQITAEFSKDHTMMLTDAKVVAGTPLEPFRVEGIWLLGGGEVTLRILTQDGKPAEQPDDHRMALKVEGDGKRLVMVGDIRMTLEKQ